MQTHKTSPWFWVPSLYFMEGLPFTIIVIVSTIMYKNFNIANGQITFYTGLLYLPWMLKPSWAWIIDLYKSKRFWIYSNQLLMGISFMLIALSFYSTYYFYLSILLFWLCAFFAATHDAAVDGFYLIGLNSSEQSFFIGQQNLFYQLAKLFGSGVLVFSSGILLNKCKLEMREVWQIVMLFAGLVVIILSIYHSKILPKMHSDAINSKKLVDHSDASLKTIITEFWQLDNLVATILFIMTFRIGENQIIKVAPLFMLDPKSQGGLGLSNGFLGFCNIFVLGAMIVAGILGGLIIYRFGLKKCIWYMFILVNIPHVIYVYLAYYQPDSRLEILFLQVVENFATTFSLAVYAMVSFKLVANSRFKTAHYAFISAFKIAGIVLPSMFSGMIVDLLGYKRFFLIVVFSMLPCLLVIPFVKIEKNFGKKCAS